MLKTRVFTAAPQRFRDASPLDEHPGSQAGRAISPAAPFIPLRGVVVVAPGAHRAVLLFVTLFLGVFGSVWPYAEASVDRCEHLRFPRPACPTIAAANPIPSDDAPPTGDPVNGLGDGWSIRGHRHQAVDPSGRGSLRVLRRGTASGNRGLDRSSFHPLSSSCVPQSARLVARVVPGDAFAPGVPYVQTLASRGPPRRLAYGVHARRPFVPAAFVQAAGDPASQPPAPATPSPPPWYQTILLDGLVSTSYVANFNSPQSRTNQFRVFDADDRTARLDVVELVFQRPVTKPGDIGFRTDLTFGSSVPHVTAALGLFRDASGRAGDFDVQQAFLSYVVPVGRGVRIDAGKFVTHVGYEVIEGYAGFNDNHSRGLLFGYAEPFTHTGFRVSYSVSDEVSAQLLVVNGWDDARDNNSGKSIGAQLAVTPSPRVSLTANYIGGPEQANDNSNLRHLLDLIAVVKLTPAVTLTANYDYGMEAAVALPETAGGGVRDSTWQGFAGYARYAFSGRTAVTLRGEWFDDAEGARTGFVQNLKEVTLTPEFRPHPVLVIRGDLRRDWSDKAVFELSDGTFSRSQVTFSINALFVF